MAQKKKKGGAKRGGGKPIRRSQPTKTAQSQRATPAAVQKHSNIPPAVLDYLQEEAQQTTAHKPATWTAEQVQRFIMTGQFDDDENESDDRPEEKDEREVQPSDDNTDLSTCLDKSDLDLRYALRPMPQPGDVNDIYQSKGSGGQQCGDMTGMLANLLDPDAGGAGRNATGIEGMLAASRKANNQERPVDPRERLRLRMRMMRKMRGAEGKLGNMIDPAEFAAAGVRLPRNMQLQKQSAGQRRSLIEAMREKIEQRKALATQQRQLEAAAQ